MNKDKEVYFSPKYHFGQNFGVVYFTSFKRLLKTKLLYLILVISLFVAAFVYFFIPYVSNLGDISQYYVQDTWVVLTMQGTFSVFALIGAVMGEANAINSENIYFLSKSIKRSTFLSAKCLSTLTISFFIALPTILILVGIASYESMVNKNNIFDISRGENSYAIFGSFLAILVFSSFISTIWRYQTRGGIWILTCFGIMLIYAIIYPMVVNVWEADFTNYERFWWLMLPVPTCMLLTIISVALGAYIFIKGEIES